MTRSTSAALAFTFLLGLPVFGGHAAAEPIEGIWKADLSSVQFDARPDEYLLKDGRYTCRSCKPTFTIPADGAFHPVAGLSYADEIAVSIVDGRTVTQAYRKNGRDIEAMTFSADGNRLKVDFRAAGRTSDSPPVTGQVTRTRVSAAPAGAHAISGSWKLTRLGNVPEGALTVTYRLEGGMLHRSSPAGRRYVARLSGTQAPVQGGIPGTTVSVSKLGENSYREIYKRDGRTVSVTTITIDANGKLHGTIEDMQSGSTIRWVATRP